MNNLFLIVGCFSLGLMLLSLMASPWNLSKKIALVLTIVLSSCVLLVVVTYYYISGSPVGVNFIGGLMFVSIMYHLILLLVSLNHQLSLQRQQKSLQKKYKVE